MKKRISLYRLFATILLFYSGIVCAQNIEERGGDSLTIYNYNRVLLQTDVAAYLDAIAYRELFDSVKAGLDSANVFIAQQNDLIKQGNKTIEAKDESTAFYKSQAEMWAKESNRQERKSKFWSCYAGIMTFIAGVSIMIILK